MAGLKPVEPEIIGKVRGAQRSTRYIPTDDGSTLREAARGAFQAQRAIAGAVDAFAVLNKKREDAEFSKAMLDAEAEADRRYQDEVLSQKGVSAGGSYDRQQTIYRETLGKYLPNVPRQRREAFELAWQKRSNAYGRNAMGYEAQQLDASYLQTQEAGLKNSAGAFVNAGGDVPAAMQAVESLRGHSDAIFRKTQGPVVEGEALKAAEQAYKENKLLVPGRMNPDGTMGEDKYLKIVDDEPKEGEVSRKEADATMSQLRALSDKYNKSWQNLMDGNVTQVVYGMIRKGDTAGARVYLDEAKRQGWVSEGAATGLSSKVLEANEVYETQDSARRLAWRAVIVSSESTVTLLQGRQPSISSRTGAPDVEADPESQRYGSPDQDKRFYDLIDQVNTQYASDPKRANDLINAARREYSDIKKKQKVDYDADVNKWYAETLKQKGYSARLTYIQTEENMPRRVRRDVEKMVEAREEADKKIRQRDPLYLHQQDVKLAQFELALARGKWEGTVVDSPGRYRRVEITLDSEDNIRRAIGYLGLSTMHAQKVADYITNSKKKADRVLVAEVLQELLGTSTAEEAIAYLPQAGDLLDRIKGTSPINADRKWIKTELVGILSQTVSNYNRAWFDTNIALGDFGRGGGSPKEHYMDEEQAEAFARLITSRKQAHKGIAPTPKGNESNKEALDSIIEFFDVRGKKVFFVEETGE